MQFNYPNITSGYLGIKTTEANLCASFYAELFGDNSNMDKVIMFPQRVHKQDFFEELLTLEGYEVKEIFIKFKNNLLHKATGCLDNFINRNGSCKLVINWLNLLLRYGLFKEVSVIDISYISKKATPSELLEIELIIEIALFHLNDNDILNYSTSKLLYLAEKALTNDDLSTRIQIIILNYMIVSAYRFGVNIPYQAYLRRCYEKLTRLTDSSIENNFGAVMRASVACRGLAMVKEIDASLKQSFLNKAEFLARNIKCENALETITAKENLYTCLQTLSKWNTFINKFNLAEKNLTEMLELDPYDSVGYGEMALFLLNQERFKDASIYFKRAAQLGPPAVGMHTYYYAKCLQNIGENVEAVAALQESAKLDQLAVSPLLDLVEYYLNETQYKEAKKIATSILKNPIYENQLEDDELIKLKELLGV